MDNQNPLSSGLDDRTVLPNDNITPVMPPLPPLPSSPTPPTDYISPMAPPSPLLPPLPPIDQSQPSTPAWTAILETPSTTIPGPVMISDDTGKTVLPESLPRPKKKVLPAVTAAIVLLLVVGVAGSAYYVSTQLATRTAIAPTAPESEPQAAESGLIPPTMTPGPIPESSMCLEVKVGIKNNEGKWVRIKSEDVAGNVKIGDTIRLLARANPWTKEIRFKMGIAGAGEWKIGMAGGAEPKVENEFFTEVTVNEGGSYSFEAQAR